MAKPMTRLAMVMAGGASTRMRASGIRRAKPLVQVAGATLLERNVDTLLRYGFDDIVIATSAKEPEVVGHARAVATRVGALGGRISIVAETVPLGNIGAVAQVQDRPAELLVVYADNLTGLDLRALADDHGSHDAAMTIAVHRQSFAMPFGEVSLDGSTVCRYREKPTIDFVVCSAIAMIGPNARREIGDHEAIGISDFVNRLLDRGYMVRAFLHDAAWTDVNDRAAIAEAERMIAANPQLFPVVHW